MVTAREEILSRLKAAQTRRGARELEEPDFSGSVYPPLKESLTDEFREKLELLGGHVLFCEDPADLVAILQDIMKKHEKTRLFCLDNSLQDILNGKIEYDSEEKDFAQVEVGFTRCEYLVAHTGSVLISAAQQEGRRLNVFPEIHTVIASEHQLVDFLETALDNIRKKYKNQLPSLVSAIIGPSRTADIEKTLVMGMHGPRALYVIITRESI